MHFIFSLNLSSVAHEISSLEDPNGANSRKGLLEKINNKLDKFPNFSGGRVADLEWNFQHFFWTGSLINYSTALPGGCSVCGWLAWLMYVHFHKASYQVVFTEHTVLCTVCLYTVQCVLQAIDCTGTDCTHCYTYTACR